MTIDFSVILISSESDHSKTSHLKEIKLHIGFIVPFKWTNQKQLDFDYQQPLNKLYVKHNSGTLNHEKNGEKDRLSSVSILQYSDGLIYGILKIYDLQHYSVD